MLSRLCVVAFVVVAACNTSKGGGGDAGILHCARRGFPSSPATGLRPSSVKVVDVTGDGKLDLVVANGNSNTVSVLVGNGDGTFQAKVDYPTGGAPFSLALADVTADGKPDLVVANLDSTVSVLVGNGDGTFKAKV